MAVTNDQKAISKAFDITRLDSILETNELFILDTWKEQESYEEYVTRLKSNGLAAAVKRADLADHLAPSIDEGPTWLEKHHPDLYNRYR